MRLKSSFDSLPPNLELLFVMYLVMSRCGYIWSSSLPVFCNCCGAIFDVFRWSRPSCSSLLKCYFSLFVVIGAGNMCWAEGWSCRADLLRLLAEPTIGLFCCYYWLVCMRNSFDACSLIKAFFPKLVVFAPVNWLIKVFSCDTDAIGPSSCYLFYCL